MTSVKRFSSSPFTIQLEAVEKVSGTVDSDQQEYLLPAEHLSLPPFSRQPEVVSEKVRVASGISLD